MSKSKSFLFPNRMNWCDVKEHHTLKQICNGEKQPTQLTFLGFKSYGKLCEYLDRYYIRKSYECIHLRLCESLKEEDLYDRCRNIIIKSKTEKNPNYQPLLYELTNYDFICIHEVFIMKKTIDFLILSKVNDEILNDILYYYISIIMNFDILDLLKNYLIKYIQ